MRGRDGFVERGPGRTRGPAGIGNLPGLNVDDVGIVVARRGSGRQAAQRSLDRGGGSRQIAGLRELGGAVHEVLEFRVH